MKILVSYDYFLPAYKAGGPIQSIANMVRYLKDDFGFNIVCSAGEFGTDKPLDIETDTWIDFEQDTAKIFYISKPNESANTVKLLLKNEVSDLLFINGIFNLFYGIYFVIFSKKPVILSVRGMLHPGGMSQKRIKKRIFITALKLWGIEKRIAFHATDSKEEFYIKEIIGPNAQIYVCANFPKLYKSSSNKKVGNFLKMCSIALISPMKNHLQVLKALLLSKKQIAYDIYGPIKDSLYWDKCLIEIEKMPPNVKIQYHGEINPGDVEQALLASDVFILPSKSENYGHALVEALSAGKPIITSYNTPWQNLQQLQCGWNVDPENTQELLGAIEMAASLDTQQYQEFSNNAALYARQKIDVAKIKKQYIDMFNHVYKQNGNKANAEN